LLSAEALGAEVRARDQANLAMSCPRHEFLTLRVVTRSLECWVHLDACSERQSRRASVWSCEMDEEHGKVTLRLLGPVSAHLLGRPVMPTAPKQRQMLALLALHAGRVVTRQTLVEELWGDEPPRSFATTLQTYVLQLRARLAEAAGDRGWARRLLETKPAGYQFNAQLCDTDVAQFQRLVRAGRRAAEAGDLAATAELLGGALALWHGPALVDVPAGRVLRAEVAALEETRLGALERRIDADLALGRHADLLGELTMLVARNPMNENFRAQLMTALYHSGRPGYALEVFRQARSVLREELGVEPGPRLQRLHQAILTGDLDAESTWLAS
jgi:DNA-binding SARP family transcriptional activator